MKYTDEQLMVYLEGTMEAVEKEAITNWLQQSTEGQKRLNELKSVLHMMDTATVHAPTEALDWKFRAMLQQEMAQQPRSSFTWLHVAAGIALFIMGTVLGRLLIPNNVPSADLAALKQQVESLQIIVLDRTLTNATASERLQVLQTSTLELDKPNGELINILLQTLNTDQSPNVRFAALDALGQFIEVEHVRLALVKSLDYQSEPIIQIALINVLATAGEKSAIASLRSLMKDEKTRPEVKKQATIAYNILL